MEVPLKPEHLKQTQHCKSTISSVQFSHSVVSDSLQCHGLQHAWPPCPLSTPRVYSNSCPLSWWCHPIISSSVVLFSSRLQSFLASVSFPVSQFFASGGQSIGVSASASVLLLGKHTDWNRPPWPGTTVTICMSCFTTGGPGKEQGTNKPPPTRRAQERSKGDTTCPTTSQNPSLWHPSWLSKTCTTRKDSESEWLAKDNPETNPITIKPETASHAAEQSWVPLPYCSPRGVLSQ